VFPCWETAGTLIIENSGKTLRMKSHKALSVGDLGEESPTGAVRQRKLNVPDSRTEELEKGLAAEEWPKKERTRVILLPDRNGREGKRGRSEAGSPEKQEPRKIVQCAQMRQENRDDEKGVVQAQKGNKARSEHRNKWGIGKAWKGKRVHWARGFLFLDGA